MEARPLALFYVIERTRARKFNAREMAVEEKSFRVDPFQQDARNFF